MIGKFDKFLARYRESDEGVAENGLPAGGTLGQVLRKIDGTDYNAEWDDEAAGVSSNFLCVWFEAVAEGTSGTLSAPTGGTLVADQWPDAVDALATRLDAAGRPTWETPRTAAGALVTATLNVATGAWELSAAPDAYPVGVVFAYTIGVASYDSDYALIGPDYQGDEPMTAVETPADADKFHVWQGGVLKYRLWSSIASTFSGLLSDHTTTHPAPTTRDARNEAAGVAIAKSLVSSAGDTIRATASATLERVPALTALSEAGAGDWSPALKANSTHTVTRSGIWTGITPSGLEPGEGCFIRINGEYAANTTGLSPAFDGALDDIAAAVVDLVVYNIGGTYYGACAEVP